MEILPGLTVMTGNGKGKTTSGMGRALIAAWLGKSVMVVQFLKGTGYTGELQAAAFWRGRLVIRQFGAGCRRSSEIAAGRAECLRCGECFRGNRRPENRFADQAFTWAKAAADSGDWDVLVLDEISHCLNKELLGTHQVTDWIRTAMQHVRLVATGRNMPPELVLMADEATECRMVKHPINRGIYGRRGSEY